MEWVYERPFTKTEEEAYRVLKKRMKKADLAKETVKLISLVGFLRTHTFKNPKELSSSVFYDIKKEKPIFTEKTAKETLKALKKKHGGKSEYPFTDYLARNTLNYLGSWLPDVINFPVQNIYGLLTTPVMNLKENIPLTELALKATHGLVETGVTTTGDVGEAAGGPVGAAIAAPFTAIAAGIASTIALAENDLGQAVVHTINATPMFGSAGYTAVQKLESQVKSLQKQPTIASYVPVVNDYVATALPKAGKRFSTQRRRHNKWQKTLRTKFVKT
jgi:hypothetical protein